MGTTTRTTSRELVALQRRVTEWRAAHGGRGHRGAPIPEEIWLEAAKVAGKDGVGATARALHFHQGRLRDRLAEAAAPVGPSRSAVAFVEVQVPQKPGCAEPRAVMEIVAPDGERMRIEVAGFGGEDVGDLARALWRRGS